MTTPNEIGSKAEQRITKRIGGKGVPQSGGGKFYKLDVRKGIFIISSKATKKKYIRITADMFREAMRAARGARGAGDGVRWAVVTEVDGFLVVIQPFDDWVDILTGEVEPQIEMSKSQTRRMRARQ